MKIVYILPGVDISGGVAVVLQHANRLIDRGYDVSILNVGSKKEIRWFKNKANIIWWDIKTKKECPIDKIDIAIATHFSTAKIVNENVESNRKIYFVQSDERRFELSFKDFLECNNSYKLNLEYMTEAVWIQRWLKEEFGHDAYYVPNGLDEKIFFKTKPLEDKGTKKRVLLEGPIDIPFKGMQDAYDAVKDLDCELWIISSFGRPKENWRYDRFFERVPMNEMNKIYSSCDIFLKMSKVEGFFGPPLEAMACGCSVVVAKCTGYDEYIKNNENAEVVEMLDIAGARNAIGELLKNDLMRKKIIKQGLETAKLWSWERSINYLEKVIKKENVEIFYSDSFPEKYNYVQLMEGIRDDIICNNLKELGEIREELTRLKNDFLCLEKNNISISFYFLKKIKIVFIYFKNGIKFLLFHPKKFKIKYRNKLFGKN